MKNSMKNNTAQSSLDLKLVLLDKEDKTPEFPVFNSREAYVNGWSVVMEIIGESHKVTVRHETAGLWLTEILACIPSGIKFANPLCQEILSDSEGKELSRTLDRHSYTFKHQKLNFEDRHYEPVIMGMLKAGTKKISYDFAKGAKDFEISLYAPATLINLVSDDASVTWTSLHTYPDEKLSILSQSRIKVTKD